MKQKKNTLRFKKQNTSQYTVRLIGTLVAGLMLFVQCSKSDMDNENSGATGEEGGAGSHQKVELTVDSCILIPVGQLLKRGSAVEISIDSGTIDYTTIDDGLGGFWAIVPYNKFTQTFSALNVKITRRKTFSTLFTCTNDTTGAYPESSKYINWKDFYTKSDILQIYDEGATRTENAMAIREYVRSYITFDNSYTDYFGTITARRTFLEKRGICINYTRLFIALCRSVGIPARSVSGVVFHGGTEEEDCFHHHQWAEFLDENNQWYPLELLEIQEIDISEAKYIGFTYCAEETELFSDYSDKFISDRTLPIKTENECWLVYWYLPVTVNGKYGFKLVKDDTPDSVVFQKTITVYKAYGSISPY